MFGGQNNQVVVSNKGNIERQRGPNTHHRLADLLRARVRRLDLVGAAGLLQAGGDAVDEGLVLAQAGVVGRGAVAHVACGGAGEVAV